MTGFTLDLDDSQFEQVKSQLVAKYGAGKLDDGMKDEQCLYRNGANFKVTSGTKTTQWRQHVSPTEEGIDLAD
ncbi:hypothetical protein BZM27_52555 [Paraburkholderia steynii]|uniref:Uncharacterized protein n=1 Tax=Paraburkholderia steynii TaxID=1245441 RepID=A0A4R0WYW5_9BURK|nr:hypothetical protein BZM27_52555 [Paraburkholderia steynii]